MLEKNLFLHDLAVVAVIKNGAPYLKEWLDYHLAAGVNHFFLYDNESTDDSREVLKPYIEKRQVDLLTAPGKLVQIPAYNDAVHRLKFACRYMAFINLDEFIFPKGGRSIVETVDEILSGNPNAAGLAINWQVFGSNHQGTADYSKGVLERFTRRATSDWFEPATKDTLPVGNIHVKSIVNPRYVRYIVNPHYAYYFDGKFAVNSNGERVNHWSNEPVLADKIVVNRYATKSREEFKAASDDMSEFYKNNHNEVFDDDILTYRKLRMDNYTPPKNFDREEYFRALEEILLPASRSDVPNEFFEGKLETFLTCRALAGIFRRNFPKDNRGRFMEESALRAINRTQLTKMSFAEIMMMLNALPPILVLPYPAVENICQNCMEFTRQIIAEFRKGSRWEQSVDMNNFLEMLAAFNAKFKQTNGATHGRIQN